MQKIDFGILIAVIVLESAAIVVNVAYAESRKPDPNYDAIIDRGIDIVVIATGVGIPLFIYLHKERSYPFLVFPEFVVYFIDSPFEIPTEASAGIKRSSESTSVLRV